MNDKLKPCPFCGGKAELQNYVDSYIPRSSVAFVKCKKCRCSTSHYTDRKGDFEYMTQAIEAWNRRVNE